MTDALSRREARIHDDAAGADAKIVVAAPEAQAAKLRHLQPASFGPVLQRDVLENDDAVGQAVELQVALGAALVVEEENGTGAAREEMFQRKDLSPEAQRIAGEETHL